MAARRVMTSLRSMRTRADAVIRQVSNEELQVLKEKEKLPWGQLSKEEKVALYRAAYGQTRKEMQVGQSDLPKVLMGVVGGLAVSYLMFKGLQVTSEPSPRTVNKEWADATKAREIEAKANPIANKLI